MKKINVLLLSLATITGSYQAYAMQIGSVSRPQAVTLTSADKMLFKGITKNKESLIKIAFLSGANVNAKELFDETPLMRAAHSGNTNIIRMLLDKGADINALDKGQKSALFYAASTGHPAAVITLYAHGADPHTISKDGSSVLVSTLRRYIDNKAQFRKKGYGSTEKFEENIKTIIKLLVEAYKVNINTPDNNKITTLMLAAGMGLFDLVKFLVEHGANMNVKDIVNRDAISYAQHYPEIIGYLKSKIAEAEFLEGIENREKKELEEEVREIVEDDWTIIQ